MKSLPQDHHQMAELYRNGVSISELARWFKCRTTTCRTILLQSNVQLRNHSDASRLGAVGRKRRYSLNESFFANIDTEEKAYWLGFIAGDGCILTAKNPRALGIGLQASDEAHLQKFLDVIESTSPIRHEHKSSIFPQGHTHTGEYSRIYISCPRLVRDLMKHGITPKKSLTLKPWYGSSHLQHHYWRGMVDADGWLSVSNEAWCIGLCGSYDCVEAFRAFAESVCGTRGIVKKNGTNCWAFSVGGNYYVRSLVQAIYEGAAIALDRKMVLAQEILSMNLPDLSYREMPGEEIRQRYEAGQSAQSLANNYGVSIDFIMSRVSSSGGRLRTISESNRLARGKPIVEIDDAILRAEYELGRSLAQLSHEYNVSASYVSRAIERAGGQTRNLRAARFNALNKIENKPLPTVTDSTLRTEYESGLSLGKLSRQYNLNPVTISRAIRRAGGAIRNLKNARANHFERGDK